MKTLLFLVCVILEILGVPQVNENCDECERCGKNFYSWHVKIQNVKNGTKLHTECTNFEGSFSGLNRQLDFIENLLRGTDDVVLNTEEIVEKIQQHFGDAEKLMNTTQDLLVKLTNDAHFGGEKIDEYTHKLKMYKQKLKQLSLDTKKLEEKSVKGNLNKISVILKKMKIISQAVPENNSNTLLEELKNLKNDLIKIKNDTTHIKESVFSTNPHLKSLEKLQNQTVGELNVKNERTEKIARDVLSLNIFAIKNTCENILNVTKDTLQNSLKILNRTKLTSDIKFSLKQKQPNLKDFEDTTKKILAKKLILKAGEIEELKNALVKIIESNQNPFAEEFVKRIEREHENSANEINRLKIDDFNKTITKLKEIETSQKNLDEKINLTLLTMSNFNDSFKKFHHNLNSVQKALEKSDEKLKILEDSIYVFDAIKDASSTSKSIESDAINLLGEYEKLMKNFDGQNDDLKKIRKELDQRVFNKKKTVRMDALLSKASRLGYASKITYDFFLKDLEILLERLNGYLIAIELSTVENNNC